MRQMVRENEHLNVHLLIYQSFNAKQMKITVIQVITMLNFKWVLE